MNRSGELSFAPFGADPAPLYSLQHLGLTAGVQLATNLLQATVRGMLRTAHGDRVLA